MRKRKRYVIGIGYPWYSSHLESITIYNKPSLTSIQKQLPEIIMLDPKETHNGRKYKLILEET